MSPNRALPPFHGSFPILTICLLTLSCGILSAQAPSEPRAILIPLESTWRYHDGNQDLGNDWREPAYNDATWQQGPALLGYDTGDRTGQWPKPGLQTQLRPNLSTYYFRQSFDYEGPIENQRLIIEHIIDDGVVYYLNGQEIGRSEHMPSGEVAFGTLASGITNPWDAKENLIVDNPPLRHGRNVLAATVHNQATGSSDICFGAQVSVKDILLTPIALYLSWQQDPTSTMTIQWHTEGDTGPAALEYGTMDGPAIGTIPASTRPMPYSERLVHTVEITGLSPETEYRFRISNLQPGIHSAPYKFRTMPETAHRPIRIAFGGDIMHRAESMAQVNRLAVNLDPEFIVWGGDLAYSDGREDRIDREYTFFDVMTETLVTDDGRVIPVVMGIGNHEVVGGYYWGSERGREAYEDTDAFRESIAPYYYSLVAFPGHPGYGVLDFGDYLSIVLLDTDHSGPIEGTQTEWLAQTLAARENVSHLIPVYHVPAYPSVRSFGGATSARVREHWLPLFEQHGIRLAFEHHDHAYKRTIPIRDGKPHDEGIVFIGDGAWGVGEREVHNAADTWYLEKAISIRHLILLTIQDEHQDLKMINREGKLIDHYIPRR